MPNYRKMYTLLFNKVTDIIYELQAIQKKTEEIYISSDEPNIVEIERPDDDR